jgi:pilus assembly protein FimV
LCAPKILSLSNRKQGLRDDAPGVPMTLRLSSLRAMFTLQGKSRVAAAAVVAVALTGAGLNDALAAPDSAASAPEAASMSYAAGSQYTVRPGQSLNDVAIAVTQSHDKATLARASHALFDANPNAFMSHDPSRMRVGAMLTVPELDASGALAASSVSASSAASASAPGAATGAASAAVGATSSASQANAAADSATSAASHVAAPTAVSGTVGAATEASPAASAGAATSGATASAPAAGSQAAALPASDAHAWSGSIQPSASEPAAGAQLPGTAAAPTSAAALSASQPKVSSLQQLLALKNRVLMELQKHGIGGSAGVGGAVATSAVAPAGGAPAAASVTPGHGAVTAPASDNGDLSQKNLSIAAAVGAALVVLLSALRMRRRKRENVAAAEAAAADRDVAARDSEPPRIVSTGEPAPLPDASDDGNDAAVISAAALAAAEREAAEGNAAQREAAERETAQREAEIRRAASQEAEERDAAARATADHAAADRATAERVEAEQAAAAQARAQETEHEAGHEAEHEATSHPSQADALSQEANLAASSDAWQERATASASGEPSSGLKPNTPPPVNLNFSPEPLPEHPHDTIDAATTAASLAAAAELGAEALPLKSLEPVDETILQEELTRHLQWSNEPAPGALAEQELSAEPQNNQNVPPPVIDFPQQHTEPHAIVPPGQPFDDASDDASDVPLPPVPTMSIPPVPTDFPSDAVDAFSSLDMPLPPRIESTADDIRAPEALITQPVASPETTAQQAVAPHEDTTPHIADEIAAGTAGPAAVAGLGAAGFGALKLDFDLELPPSPAQPWPAFTQTDLIRIARNKLDLASEYIELGDLSGARTLINEVIEANDPATRTEARALLSTLAPLS